MKHGAAGMACTSNRAGWGVASGRHKQQGQKCAAVLQLRGPHATGPEVMLRGGSAPARGTCLRSAPRWSRPRATCRRARAPSAGSGWRCPWRDRQDRLQPVVAFVGG
eukprot:359193-Chlamydomonas_euryale.AAC.4